MLLQKVVASMLASTQPAHNRKIRADDAPDPDCTLSRAPCDYTAWGYSEDTNREENAAAGAGHPATKEHRQPTYYALAQDMSVLMFCTVLR